MQLIPQPCPLVHDVQIAGVIENPVTCETIRVPHLTGPVQSGYPGIIIVVRRTGRMRFAGQIPASPASSRFAFRHLATQLSIPRKRKYFRAIAGSNVLSSPHSIALSLY